MRQLAGRVAVVTGAAGGLGQALVRQLGAAGMDLALADLNDEGMQPLADELRATGRRVVTLQVDVSDPEALQGLLSQTLSELGACHLMCNNAGVFQASAILDASDADWHRVLDTNLWGVIHGCRVFGRHFVAQGEGHLLNTASAAGLFPIPGMCSYSTTKYAVVAFSQQLRWELAQTGVGVSVLCPGVIKTRMAAAKGVGLEHVDIDELVKRAPAPELLARKAVKAVIRNRPIVVFGPDAGILRLLRLLPAWLIDPLGRKLGQAGLQAVQPPQQLPP